MFLSVPPSCGQDHPADPHHGILSQAFRLHRQTELLVPGVLELWEFPLLLIKLAFLNTENSTGGKLEQMLDTGAELE